MFVESSCAFPTQSLGKNTWRKQEKMNRNYTQRQIEILTLLAKYGVLGTRDIRLLLKESVADNRLRESLQSMEARGYICRLALGTGGRPMNYWMLPDEDTAKGRALQVSGLKLKFFRNKRVRYSHIPHESFCTYVHASIERQMPSLLVYREATNHFNTLPDHLLSEKAKENGYTPDLCIGVPSPTANIAHSNKGYRWIAVEVDRTMRSKKRIAQRLNIYTKHTAFSGLLYLVPSESAVRSVMEIYESRGGKNSFRLRGTSDSFLCVGTTENQLFDVSRKPVAVDGKVLSMGTWLSLFSISEAHERDKIFAQLIGYTTGKVSEDTKVDNNTK